MDFGIRVNRNLYVGTTIAEGGVINVIGIETTDEGEVTNFTGHVEWDE